MSLYIRYVPVILGGSSGGGGGGGGVTSLNSLTGALTLVAGSGITITPSGSNITIAATGSSGNPYYVNEFTLTSTDISNGYVTLSPTPDNPTQVILTVIGGPMQSYGTDYTVSGSQLIFGSTLATGGQSALVSGDMLVVQYN
jgi:hypothetical protein